MVLGSFYSLSSFLLGLKLRAASKIEEEFMEKTSENELALKAAFRKGRKNGGDDVKTIVRKLRKILILSFRPFALDLRHLQLPLKTSLKKKKRAIFCEKAQRP